MEAQRAILTTATAVAQHAGELGRETKAPAALTKVTAAALHLLGFVPVYFAAQINFKSAASQGPKWANFAVISTILTAILFETAILLVMRRMFLSAFAAILLVLPFFAMNMLAATGNVASADVHSREVRKAQEKTSDNLADRRADAVERRNKATAAAAGETEQSALDKIEQAKAEHPTTWNASQHCDPEHITLAITKMICGDIAALKAKAAAAKAYDRAVSEIAEIDAKSSQAGLTVQSTGAGAAENFVAVAAWFGYQVSQEDAEKAFEWGRGGGLELGAAIGPGLMNLFAWLLLGIRDAKAAEAEVLRSEAKERHRIEAEAAEQRRRDDEARRAAEAEARAAAAAEEKVKVERAAKRAEAKTREQGDPESVKGWLNSSSTVLLPGHVLELPAAYENYAADCRSHGEAPVARGRRFAEELRKLGIDVRERGNRKRFDIHGMALASRTGRERLRVVSSR